MCNKIKLYPFTTYSILVFIMYNTGSLVTIFSIIIFLMLAALFPIPVHIFSIQRVTHLIRNIQFRFWVNIPDII